MSEWRKFDGVYADKRWYDLKLENGRKVRACWPHAGRFHSFNETDQFLGAIPPELVIEIKEVDKPFFYAQEYHRPKGEKATR